jgi:hypothetical protein
MRCGERGSRTIWTTTSTTTVLLSLGTSSSSSSSFRTLHGLLQRSRKGRGRKGKEGRKEARRRRRLSSSSACVSVCAQFGRHLETRSQILYFLADIYVAKKGYLLGKLKVQKSTAFFGFSFPKKAPNKIRRKKLNKITDPKKSTGSLSFFITGLGPGVYFNVIFILVWDLVYILR